MKINWIALLFVLLVVSTAKAQDKKQARCPILGNRIDKSIHADYRGARIYFCCAGCVDRFKKNPDRYLRILMSKGIKLAKAAKVAVPQSLCPIMGNKINKEVYVDYKGRRIYFCCPGCDKTFNDDPEKYLRQMQAKGIVLEKLKKPQSLCPIMGNKINKEVYVDYKGRRVYFCCPGCDKQFNEDPEKYIKTMEAGGVAIEPTPKQVRKG